MILHYWWVTARQLLEIYVLIIFFSDDVEETLSFYFVFFIVHWKSVGQFWQEKWFENWRKRYTKAKQDISWQKDIESFSQSSFQFFSHSECQWLEIGEIIGIYLFTFQTFRIIEIFSFKVYWECSGRFVTPIDGGDNTSLIFKPGDISQIYELQSSLYGVYFIRYYFQWIFSKQGDQVVNTERKNAFYHSFENLFDFSHNVIELNFLRTIDSHLLLHFYD